MAFRALVNDPLQRARHHRPHPSRPLTIIEIVARLDVDPDQSTAVEVVLVVVHVFVVVARTREEDPRQRQQIPAVPARGVDHDVATGPMITRKPIEGFNFVAVPPSSSSRDVVVVGGGGGVVIGIDDRVRSARDVDVPSREPTSDRRSSHDDDDDEAPPPEKNVEVEKSSWPIVDDDDPTWRHSSS